MMMKKAIPLLIITTLLFVFTSCENKALDYYKVTFDSDGGNYTPEEQYVKNGGKVIEPKAPTKSGAVFSSWTLDGSEYNFSTPVKSDITLKATYTSVYTVTFNSDGGTYTPEVQYIKEGDKVIEPKSPDKGSTRGFMWWVGADGTPYDFSKSVTSSFTLKAVYWPAYFLDNEKDPSPYNTQITDEIYHETKCLYNIITSFISIEKLMSGNNDIASIFAVKDGEVAGNTIKAIVANAKMDENHITIDGEKVDLNNTETKIHLNEDKYKTIESNKSETKDYGETGITRKKYIIDITNLAFSTTFNIDFSSKSETINTTISLKGIVLEYDKHIEIHVQFTIDGKEYPVLHAKTFNTVGGSEEITVNYRGYTGFFYTHDN